MKRGRRTIGRGGFAIGLLFVLLSTGAWAEPGQNGKPLRAGPPSWTGDLTPIADTEWSRDRAAHLLERAGFGGTPQEIDLLAEMSPDAAVRHLVEYHRVDDRLVPAFEESGVFDPSLDPFPKSRIDAVRIARANGEAMGVRVKPGGDRPLQPVVNRFFYWLRADLLEMRRAGQWWAQRMLVTPRPLQEKLALFWHGHFATSDVKVRDYRKLLKQYALFREHANGNFRDLLIGAARDPAMLVYLDAGENVKGRPNENFGREILELFTMGVGNYTETDIREASRAFTGWTHAGLDFVLKPELHDTDAKTFLGRTGTYGGVEIIDIVLDRDVTAQFIAAKLYRFFVRDDPSPELVAELGALLRRYDYEFSPLLTTIFRSRDFYGPAAYATQIKSPVHLVVSTYRKLGLREIPGVPDFGSTTRALGQELFYPPNVAGWEGGRSWITPALLLERGNFAREILFPDMVNFRPPDRWMPVTNRKVAAKIDRGFEITAATIETDAGADDSMAGSMENGMAMDGTGMAGQPAADGRKQPVKAVSMFNRMADADEDFNTRYGSTHGWQTAFRRVKPIPRHAAPLDLAGMVVRAGLTDTTQVVDYFIGRLLRTPLVEEDRRALIAFLTEELGTTAIDAAATYLEEPVRQVVHLIMSTPEYQLG